MSPRRLTEPPRTCSVKGAFEESYKNAMTCLHRHGIFDDTLVSALFVPQRWQGAAALSAAVTITNSQGIAPNSQAEPSQQKPTPRTPAALREGARGRGFSQRSRLPRISPVRPSLRKGARGRRFSLEKRPPPEFPLRQFLSECNGAGIRPPRAMKSSLRNLLTGITGAKPRRPPNST